MANPVANAVSTTGICLYALPAREEAVLKRVISFSSTQGRNYTLTEPQAADMLVLSDETDLDPALMNPAGCLLIRIADAGSAQMYDVLMQRPLLVTKVMRTLDEAKAMLSDTQSQPQPQSQPAEIADVTPSAAAPAPAVDSSPSSTIQPATPVQSIAPPSASPAMPSPDTPVQSTAPAVKVAEPVTAEKTKPAMSLYSRILGGGAAKAAAQAQAEKPAQVEEVAVAEQPLTSHESEASPDNDSGNSVPTAPSAEVIANTTTADKVAAPEAETMIGVGVVGAVEAQSTSAADTPAHDVTSNHASTLQGAHHLALVVDDSAAIRKQLELELRAAGIGAEFAETGEEAMEKVAAKRYDLIFLDIIMPGIDGYETCRQMRLRADLKKTPIIMLSAKTSPLDEVQGVIAGASTYLTKPVKSDQLQQTLKRVSMWLDNFQVSV